MKHQTIDEILEPFHRHNCHSAQAWFKGQIQPFPCDCDIKEVKQALATLIARDIVGENPDYGDKQPVYLQKIEAQVIKVKNAQRKRLENLLGNKNG